MVRWVVACCVAKEKKGAWIYLFMDIYVYEFFYFTYNFYVTRYIFEKEGARGVPPLREYKAPPSEG